MSVGRAGDYKRVGLAFAKALATRDYEVAYALMSRDYRDRTSVKAMQAAFERIVLDLGSTPTRRGAGSAVPRLPLSAMFQEHAGQEAQSMTFGLVPRSRFVARIRATECSRTLSVPIARRLIVCS
jgi:hypothetical protein